MDKEQETTQSKDTSSDPVAPEMQNVEEEEEDDQIQNADDTTTASDDVVSVERPAEVRAGTSDDFGPPTKWPKDKRGRGKIGAQAAAETLVGLMVNKETQYDVVASSGPLRIQEVQEEPSTKKPRLSEAPTPRMTYDCCACNTSFSTIQALNDHMPSHHHFEDPAADSMFMPMQSTTSHGHAGDEPPKEMQQDDDDGKGKGVYIQPEIHHDDDD